MPLSVSDIFFSSFIVCLSLDFYFIGSFSLQLPRFQSSFTLFWIALAFLDSDTVVCCQTAIFHIEICSIFKSNLDRFTGRAIGEECRQEFFVARGGAFLCHINRASFWMGFLYRVRGIRGDISQAPFNTKLGLNHCDRRPCSNRSFSHV